MLTVLQLRMSQEGAEGLAHRKARGMELAQRGAWWFCCLLSPCFVSDNSHRLFSWMSWATFMLETCVRL